MEYADRGRPVDLHGPRSRKVVERSHLWTAPPA